MKPDWLTYTKTARRAAADGCVLLKNEGKVLPLKEGVKLAVFGRSQMKYLKSGTGSGGMVNVPKVATIPEALREAGAALNEDLYGAYESFVKEHPFENGVGFGAEPWCQEEMPLTTELVKQAASSSDTALVIIGRTAGEEQDYGNACGSYKLAELEADMLRRVRYEFKKMVLVLNISAVIDMEDIIAISPDAILVVWQGGEQGAYAASDVLLGKVCPSGHLTDTILKSVEQCPADVYFHDEDYSVYGEDIYVGYRYHETFDKRVVRYPFGYGLSYTSFEIICVEYTAGGKGKDPFFSVKLKVQNVGDVPGREVVQIYVSKPQGLIGNPAVSLAAFAKTDILQPGEECQLVLDIDAYTIASYDDGAVTAYPYSYILEEGDYGFFLGENCRDLRKIADVKLDETRLVRKLSQKMAVGGFEKIRPEAKGDGYTIKYEFAPQGHSNDLKQAMEDRPECLPYAGDLGINLKDVRDGLSSMDTFLSQLTDEDLAAVIRGEGMGSPKVTPGTAAAFGGVNEHMKSLGIPCGCCSDGPSGMRLDCGTRAFSLPSGTNLACTWDEELNVRLFEFLGYEMTKNHVDVLLGPGMNIHRHPLNGRNFEYFSEDPLVTGKMAAAQIRGLKKAGVTGTLKHFCGNNKEHNRHGLNSVMTERALREIYLKGFEIAVREGKADSIMTTYGAVNGTWTNGRHDLLTDILRGEWGFEGIVMTDWWANIGDVDGTVRKNTFSRLVLSQNDFYAVCPDAAVNSTDDDTLSALEDGTICRGQLIRMAKNICTVLMHLPAMKRMHGEDVTVEFEHAEENIETVDPSSIEYFDVEDGTVIDLSNVSTQKGTSYVLGINALKRGCYFMEMTASSDQSELSQLPVAVFFQSIPGGTFTFHGTAGGWMSIQRKILFSAKYGVMRLYFTSGGIKLRDIKFTYEKEYDPYANWVENYSEYIYG